MAYIKVKDRRRFERKEFRDYIKLSDDKVLDTKKNNIDLLGDDEIFVQLEDTQHYWISNHGRLTNNMRKDKTFFFHKMDSGDPKRSVHWTIVTYDIDGTALHEETSPEILVAKYFLIKPTGCNKIWHIDENMNNNYYKNLVYVSAEEYELLRKHVKTVAELGREQEYYDYNTVKGNPAYKIYEGIYARCYGGSSLLVNQCYDDAYMCDDWKNSRDSFAEWYSANYYECDGERMAVDKDLLCRGNKEYAADKCCILPEISILPWQVLQREEAVINQQRVMLSVLIMTKEEISSMQGLHHSGMINKLSCIIGTQRKKHFKNTSYSRNQRLGHWH